MYHLLYLNASQNDDNPIDSVINPVISGDRNQPSIEDQLSFPESISFVPYLSQGLLYLFSLEFRKITFHKTPTKRRKRLWHCLLSLIGHSHYNNDWEENDRNQKTLSITAVNEFLSESAESGSLKWKSSTGPIRHVSLVAFVSMCDLSMCVNIGVHSIWELGARRQWICTFTPTKQILSILKIIELIYIWSRF